MALTLTVSRGHSLALTETRPPSAGSARLFVPRDPQNPVFNHWAMGVDLVVEADAADYEAFPYALIIGDYVVMAFSEGTAHGDSDRHIMVRKLITDLDNETVAWDRVVFFENDTLAYDLSLMSDIMSDGDIFTIRPWRVAKVGGVTSATMISFGVVDAGADAGTYSLWSQVRTYGGKFYRTGYQGGKSALFESTDQTTWTLKAVMGDDDFSESDVIETSTGYLSIMRDNTETDGVPQRRLYKSTSADLITWTTPVLMEQTGTQPNLAKLTDGSIILGVGDRIGVSGLDVSGRVTSSIDRTGAQLFRSTDDMATISAGVQIGVSWSTDCGQAFTVELPDGRLAVFYYTSTGPTDAFTEPGVHLRVMGLNGFTAA